MVDADERRRSRIEVVSSTADGTMSLNISTTSGRSCSPMTTDPVGNRARPGCRYRVSSPASSLGSAAGIPNEQVDRTERGDRRAAHQRDPSPPGESAAATCPRGFRRSAPPVKRHRLRAGLRGVGSLSGGQPAIQFLLDQCRILKQPYHFGPDVLVQQVLPHGARVAPGIARVPPPVGPDTAVVVNLPGCSRRSSICS